jgi:CBS domain-containing protein
MDTKIHILLDRKGHEVYSIQADHTVYEAIAEMDARNVGGLIVKKGDEVVGIVTERDYTRKVILKNRSSKEIAVESIMSRNLVSVIPDQTVQDALTLVTEKKCRHLPVFKDCKLDGILSIGDLVKWIIRDREFEIKVLEDYISGR